MAPPPPIEQIEGFNTQGSLLAKTCKCLGEQAQNTTQVGIIENEVLYKSTAQTKTMMVDDPEFVFPGCPSTCYEMIKQAGTRFRTLQAVGSRPVLSRQMVDGFEKLTLGPYEYTTYEAYLRRIEHLGIGLASYVAPGEYVTIYAGTQLEWTLSAFSCWRCGATVATAYDTLGEEAAAFAIKQTKSAVVFADAKLLRALSKVGAQLTTVKRIITMSDEAADSAAAVLLKTFGIEVSSLSDVEAAGGRVKAPPAPAACKPSDLAVCMYTSGTTGNPKGVQLSHSALLATLGGGTSATAALCAYTRPGERFLAYLPLAHIMELILELSCFHAGMVIGYGGVGTILPTAPKMLQTKPPQAGDAMAFQPTLFLAAPAVLDRIYAVVNGKINAAPPLISSWFRAALADGAANFAKGRVGAGPLVGLIFKVYATPPLSIAYSRHRAATIAPLILLALPYPLVRVSSSLLRFSAHTAGGQAARWQGQGHWDGLRTTRHRDQKVLYDGVQLPSGAGTGRELRGTC